MAIGQYTRRQIFTRVKGNPISYKAFDEKQFPQDEFEIGKTVIRPSASGYCTDEIKSSINLDIQDLTMVNTGTGSGKSTAIYDLIMEGAQKGYTIIVASPKQSLVDKDYNAITGIATRTGIISPEEIVHYSELTALSPSTDFTEIQQVAQKSIHIMTTSCLCRNSGEEADFQMKSKSVYLDEIIKFQKVKGRKVMIIMDEIHESIQYLKSDLLRYLSPWKKVVHKIILSTATLTEPCFALVKILSQMTDRRIKVIESDRVRLPSDRRCELDIYIASSSYTSDISGDNRAEFSYVRETIESATRNGEFEHVHILTFSESLAKNIYKAGWIPHEKAVLSIGGRKNKFNASMSNIGTTFSTGVDIVDNDLMVIILPGTVTQNGYPMPNFWGIFQQGKSIVDQAVARLRNGGKIIVMVPPIRKIINGEYVNRLYDSLPSHLISKEGNSQEAIEDEFDTIHHRYRNIHEGFQIFQNLTEADTTFEGHIPTRPFVKYQLEESHHIITKNCYGSGREIYPYFIYAACTGQFPNCNPPVFVFRKYMTFKYIHRKDDLQKGIMQFFEENHGQLKDVVDYKSIVSVYHSSCKVFRGEVVNGIQIVIQYYGDKEKKNFNDYIFRRNLLQVILKVVGGINNVGLGEYLLYRSMCHQGRDYCLPEMYEHLRQQVLKIQLYLKLNFDGFCPAEKALDEHNILKKLFDQMYSTLDTVFRFDTILRSGVWTISSPYRFFKKHFLQIGSKDTTRNNLRVYSVDSFILTEIHDGIKMGSIEPHQFQSG